MGLIYTQLASYDFTTKTDANPLPAPWESSGQNGFGLQNASGFAEGTDGTFAGNVCEAHWDGVIFPNNQYGEITIASLIAPSDAWVGLRHGESFASGYLLLAGSNGDGTQNIGIFLIAADSSFSLLSSIFIVPQAAGDVLRFEVIGSQLTGYLNGSLIVSVSDSTYASGQIAVDITDSTALTDVQISSFRAGSISVSGGAFSTPFTDVQQLSGAMYQLNQL